MRAEVIAEIQHELEHELATLEPAGPGETDTETRARELRCVLGDLRDGVLSVGVLAYVAQRRAPSGSSQ